MGYKKYVKGIRKAMRARAEGFLAKLSTCLDKEQIKECCEAEKAEFEEAYTAPNTQANYMTQYRNAIKAWQTDIELDDSNSYEQQTSKGLVRQHFALLYMNYPSGWHSQRQETTVAKKQEQRRNLVAINCVDEYLDTIERLLQSRDYRELATGLIAATGRRMSEILSSAEFEQESQFSVLFSGQLKAKGEDRKAYGVYTLVESAKVLDGLLRLHRMPEIKEMRRWNLAEIDSGKNKTINRKVKDNFGVLIDPPHGEKELSSKNLRAAYAAIAIYLFCPWSYSTNLFITERLGHVSDATASNYEDYQVTDKQGRPQTRGAWVDRLNEEVTEPMEETMQPRIRMSKRAKAVIDDKEFLPYEDAVSRMDELIRLAEIGKRWEEGKLGVREVIKEVPTPAPATEAKPANEATQEDKPQIEGMYSSTIVKIEDAIAKIKAYNESCYSPKEKYKINQSVLEQLTGCNTYAVKTYLESDRGRVNVDDYNSLYGFGLHQNRGKKPITEVIR